MLSSLLKWIRFMRCVWKYTTYYDINHFKKHNIQGDLCDIVFVIWKWVLTLKRSSDRN